MSRTPFRVIIVGGSITGLTLSHCLNKAGIDNIVLEKHHDISSPVGSSIGVFPNGGKILDQLGIFKSVEKLIEPLSVYHLNYGDGFHFSTDFPDLIKERFGLPMAFMSRQDLIRTIYESFHTTAHIHLNQHVAKVEEIGGGLRVVTADGVSYDGDLVVGADGVHSKVRSEMWALSENKGPARGLKGESRGISAEFACIFGISSTVDGLQLGEQTVCLYSGFTVMAYLGLDNRVFWFVVQKLDQKYTYPNIPRFSTDYATAVCESIKGTVIQGGAKFEDIWRNRQTFAMTALEENVLPTWHMGRLVCLGDSVVKMAPNLGQGANLAIESAAELANFLYDMKSKMKEQKPSTSDIDIMLRTFTRKRLQRVSTIYRIAGLMARIHARVGFFNSVFSRYCVPYVKNLPANILIKTLVGAPSLKYLPLPARHQTALKKKGKLNMTRDVSAMTVLVILTFAFMIWLQAEGLSQHHLVRAIHRIL